MRVLSTSIRKSWILRVPARASGEAIGKRDVRHELCYLARWSMVGVDYADFSRETRIAERSGNLRVHRRHRKNALGRRYRRMPMPRTHFCLEIPGGSQTLGSWAAGERKAARCNLPAVAPHPRRIATDKRRCAPAGIPLGACVRLVLQNSEALVPARNVAAR
jgi:hypothetical protein